MLSYLPALVRADTAGCRLVDRDLLGVKPVRSELTYMLVKLDRDYAAEGPDEPWEGYYARALVEHFAA